MAAKTGIQVFDPEVGSAAKKPEVLLEKYGASYGQDIFTLGHNAVRYILGRTYDMLYAYEVRRGDVHLGDIKDFFKWVIPQFEFIFEVFALEEAVVFPWVTTAAPGLQGEVGSRARIEIKNEIIKEIRYTIEIKRKCAQMAPVGVFRKILQAVNKWGSKLLKYYYHEEHTLPKIIEKEYTVEEKVRLDMRIAEYFLDSEDGGRKVYTLVQWMDPKQLQYWKDHNLGFRQRMAFKNWESGCKKTDTVFLRVLKKSGLQATNLETRVEGADDKKKQLRQTWAQVKKQVEREEQDRIMHELKNLETEIGANVRMPQAMKKDKKPAKAPEEQQKTAEAA